MDVILRPLIQILITVVDLYTMVLFITIIASWLVTFGVINTSYPYVGVVLDVLHRLTEPVLRPVRRWMPNLGGLDLSPIVVFLGLQFVRLVLLEILKSLY